MSRKIGLCLIEAVVFLVGGYLIGDLNTVIGIILILILWGNNIKYSRIIESGKYKVISMPTTIVPDFEVR